MTSDMKEKLQSMTENEAGGINQNLESSAGIGNSEKTQGRSSYMYIIIAVCAVAVLMIASILGILNYNNIKTQEQTAINRINSICDEINRLSTDDEISQLLAFDSKISEMDSLIKNNDLDVMYLEKYEEAKLYLNDLKTYEDISKALITDDKDAWINIQKNINRLKTERVRSKITPAVINQIQQVCESWLIFNSLKYYEEYIIKREKFENVLTGINSSYCCTVPSDIDKNFFMSVPDGQKIDDISAISFGCITDQNSDFFDIYPYGMEHSIKQIDSKVMKKAISQNKSKILIVEYVGEEMEDRYSYVAYDFELKATYENYNLNITLLSEDRMGLNLQLDKFEHEKLFTLE